VNDLWTLRESMTPLNASSPAALSLTISLSSVSLLKWQLQAQVLKSMEMQAAMHGDEQIEEVRLFSTTTTATNLQENLLRQN